MNGDDAIEYMLAGASAISIGTGNFINPNVTMETIKGIEEYMRKYNVENINSIVGTAII